jgi:hypothetical protein
MTPAPAAVAATPPVVAPAAVVKPLPPRAAPGLTAAAPGVPAPPPVVAAPPPGVTMPVPSPVIPPPPVQRGAQPGEATARPGFASRDGHLPGEVAGMPQARPIPVQRIPNPGLPEAAAIQRPDRAGPPRGGDGGRGAEVARPAPSVNRLPEPALVAAPPRPPEMQRPPSGEPKMTRPETPRRDEQRRDMPRDERSEKLQR